MEPRPVVRKPDEPPSRRSRPDAAAAQRGASGEGALSALERLIEQEKAKHRTEVRDEPDDADELRRGPRP